MEEYLQADEQIKSFTLYFVYPIFWALSVAILPLLPIWQWNTNSGVSSGGLFTPYLALNSAGSIAKAASTVSTEQGRLNGGIRYYRNVYYTF